MTALRLVWDPETPPDLTRHEGRRVEWRAWFRQPVMFICGSDGLHTNDPCEACSTDERPWTATGLIHPLPGETFTSTSKQTRSGREYETAPHEVPAWRIVRLCAVRCRECGDTRIFDIGVSGAEWDEVTTEPTQLVLDIP